MARTARGGVRDARPVGAAGRGISGGRQSARAQGSSLHAEGEAGDHALHVRRPVAPGYVRSQAAPGAGQRTSLAAREAASRGVVSQSDGQPGGIAVRVPPARRERDLDQLALSAPGPACRRPLRDQLDALLQLAARRRRARVAHRQRHVRPAQHGVVDHLRAGQREPELSGIRDDLPGPLARRCEQFRLGFPARRLPGDDAGTLRPEAAGGQDSVHRRRHGPPRPAASRARPDRADGAPTGREPRAGRRAGGADRVVRAGVSPANRSSGDAGYRSESRRPRSNSTGSTTPPRPTSARSACWPDGSRNGASDSSSATSAAGMPTTI